LFPSLYAIVDPNLINEPALDLALQLVDGGVELIQLRDKRAPAGELLQEALNWVAGLSPSGVRMIVNDRPDIAAMAGAAGVHVGQEDLPVEEARRICGDSCCVGISTHNLEQVREADRTSADYIAFGPMFLTVTKENADPVTGIELLRAARSLTQKPIVAIGGITVQSAPEIYRAGADSVAVIRDLILARDPAQRAREYLSLAEGTRGRSL
jgi:thiamine-phosphate pyrophosphorylase